MMTAATAATAAARMLPAEAKSTEPSDDYPTADRKATREVRRMLSYLREKAGKSLVSGQTDYPDVEWVKANTGKSPAIVGLDFMHTTAQLGKETSGTATAIDWWHNKHGFITFQWHWVSPIGAHELGQGFYTNKTDFDLAAALKDTNSPDYKGLISDIDDIAVELKKLAAAHVPILFRPLHEAQGGWFWWGAKGPEACVQLYHIIYDRLVHHHKIHNLAWVWVAFPEHDGKGAPKAWYPGDDFVDIIASDYCESARDFDALMQLGGGKKLVALAETMNAPDPDKALGDGGTPWAYWVTWARRDWHKNSEQDMKTAMANPRTITLEDMPDVSRW